MVLRAVTLDKDLLIDAWPVVMINLSLEHVQIVINYRPLSDFSQS